MNPKEAWILIIGGLIKLFDGGTDILYITTQDYLSNVFRWLSLGFIIAPTSLMLIIFTISIILQSSNIQRSQLRLNMIIAYSISIGEQFGLCSLMYGILFFYRPSGIEKELVLYMCRLAAVFNTFFESMPQIVLQSYNSGHMMEFGWVGIVSCACSGASILFSFFRIFYAYDQSKILQNQVEMMSARKYLATRAWRNTEITLEHMND
jgi:hypothetical protein